MAKTRAESAKERYDRLRAEGKCARCAVKMKKSEAAHAYCQDCRTYLSDRDRVRRAGLAKPRRPDGEALTGAQYEAERRERARAAGKCYVCNRRKMTPGRATCATCRRAERARARKRAEKST